MKYQFMSVFFHLLFCCCCMYAFVSSLKPKHDNARDKSKNRKKKMFDSNTNPVKPKCDVCSALHWKTQVNQSINRCVMVESMLVTISNHQCMIHLVECVDWFFFFSHFVLECFSWRILVDDVNICVCFLYVWVSILFYLFLGSIFTCANNILHFHGGHHGFFVKLTDYFAGWLTALLLNQFITVQCHYTFNGASIHGLFIEFFAQFEGNFRILECRWRNQCIYITVFLQFNGRRDGIANLTENKSNTCSNRIRRKNNNEKGKYK